MHVRYWKSSLHCTLTVLLLSSPVIHAAPTVNAQVFGDPYTEFLPAAPDQAHVIYFRPALESTQAAGANLYIDGRFHTTLLPGGYTSFCLPPGYHLLGAYQNDAPFYKGKTEELYRVNLEAGKTYFVKVSENGTGVPVSVERDEAEQSLKNTYEQIHVISRANTPTCHSSE